MKKGETLLTSHTLTVIEAWNMLCEIIEDGGGERELWHNIPRRDQGVPVTDLIDVGFEGCDKDNSRVYLY